MGHLCPYRIIEKFKGDIWECACGDGAMSRVLGVTGCSPVFSSDLYERGYGKTGVDFLNTTRTADNIVTNPPYNCAEGFVAQWREACTSEICATAPPCPS